jgi:hypothetical protein
LGSVYDLNNALLSFILTGYSGFLSAAGYVGPNFRVDHDITYLLPEVWGRMSMEERDPKFLIEHGYLERCENFRHNGHLVQAERLGYRITRKFVKTFGGRIFSSPDTMFPDAMLRPETQDVDIFVDSMNTIVDAHRRAADLVIACDGISQAIPPLRALLSITVNGEYEGMTLGDERFRAMFLRENVINSNWYIDRLKKYQSLQLRHLTSGLEYIQHSHYRIGTFANSEIDIQARADAIAQELNFVGSDTYLKRLIGTLGA